MNGQALTPQQQQLLVSAYAQSAANSKGQTTVLSAEQQKLLAQQGLTPAQIQAYTQLQGVSPAQLQALSQSYTQVPPQTQQVAGTPCQPVANAKGAGMGGLFGKMAGSALRSGLVPGMSAEAAATAATVAENAGAMTDCVPATK